MTTFLLHLWEGLEKYINFQWSVTPKAATKSAEIYLGVRFVVLALLCFAVLLKALIPKGIAFEGKLFASQFLTLSCIDHTAFLSFEQWNDIQEWHNMHHFSTLKRTRYHSLLTQRTCIQKHLQFDFNETIMQRWFRTDAIIYVNNRNLLSKKPKCNCYGPLPLIVE